MIENNNIFSMEYACSNKIYRYDAPNWFTKKIEEFKNVIKEYVYKDYSIIYNDYIKCKTRRGDANLYSMVAKSEKARKTYFISDWIRCFLHDFTTDMNFNNKTYKTSIPHVIIEKYKVIFSKLLYKIARKNYILR